MGAHWLADTAPLAVHLVRAPGQHVQSSGKEGLGRALGLQRGVLIALLAMSVSHTVQKPGFETMVTAMGPA